MLCEYGCGKKADYQFKNGRWCCSKSNNSCPKVRENLSKKFKGELNPFYKKTHTQKVKNIISKTHKDKIPWNKNKQMKSETKIKISNSKKGTAPWIKGKTGIYSKEVLEKIGEASKLTISKIKRRYSFFSKIEEMRYNPDKPKEKEIQVHCKNHLCKNSKENNGWFTPTRNQVYERARQLENKNGNGGSYFYCSEKCKKECPLYYLKGDPYKNTELQYTQEEYETFRQFVLERDDYICQYCGKEATIVHHERPQKLEPLFVLDPDFAWSCCEKCHYEKGHKTGTECSTGNLSNVICK